MRIYHNPRCSKSRQCLAELHQLGHPVEEVLYLEQPLNAQQLQELLGLLQMKASEVIRKGEPLYKELQLAEKDEQQHFLALVEHPQLLERPIVVHQGRAVVARPWERIRELLD